MGCAPPRVPAQASLISRSSPARIDKRDCQITIRHRKQANSDSKNTEVQLKTSLAIIEVTPPKNSKLGDLRWHLDGVGSSIPNEFNVLNQPSGRRVPFLPSTKPDNFPFSVVNYLIFDCSKL